MVAERQLIVSFLTLILLPLTGNLSLFVMDGAGRSALHLMELTVFDMYSISVSSSSSGAAARCETAEAAARSPTGFAGSPREERRPKWRSQRGALVDSPRSFRCATYLRCAASHSPTANCRLSHFFHSEDVNLHSTELPGCASVLGLVNMGLIVPELRMGLPKMIS